MKVLKKKMKKKRERRGADALGNWEDICLLAHTRRVKKKKWIQRMKWEYKNNILLFYLFVTVWPEQKKK